MQLYIACLSSYNNGELYGRWIDATADPDEMQADIAEMLRGSKFPNVTVECPECEGDGCDDCHDTGKVPSAAEWYVHDYDGFPNLGEYPSLGDVAEIVAIADDFDFIGWTDLRAILDDFQNQREARDALDDRFVGIFDGFRDYADEAAEEMLSAHDVKDDNPLARYFDYEAWARDLAYDMHTIECPSGVAVFYA